VVTQAGGSGTEYNRFMAETNGRRNRARLAWDLLSTWHTTPGFQADGTLNATLLCSWFHDARRICASKGRARIGDTRIGEALAYAPADPDGVWPHRAVRDLIEEAESRDLESGLHAGRINGRGVWTKSPSEGGLPERELAKSYLTNSRALTARWPRTATVLASLAQTYERMARHEDTSAEKLDLL
jgi:hypothetical protein